MTDSTMNSLSRGQLAFLSFFPIFPSFLSIIASSIVIRLVIISKTKTTYKRILCGIAANDLLIALVALDPFLAPETTQWPWAVGNDKTCAAMGFLHQLSFSSFYYNASLSVYFLLVIRFGMADQVIARKVEPWMHVVSLGFALVSAVIILVLGLYHQVIVGPGCWIKVYDESERKKERISGYVLGFVPVALAFLTIISSNIFIYMHVRKTLVRSGRRSSFTSENNGARMRAVSIQSFLYVAVFLLTTIWTTMLRIIEQPTSDANDEVKLFPLVVMQALFVPLCGLLNMFVYTRPRYLRCRSCHPSRSRFWCLRTVLVHDSFEPEGGKPPRKGRQLQSFNSMYYVSKNGDGRSNDMNVSGEVDLIVDELNRTEMNDALPECKDAPEQPPNAMVVTSARTEA